MLTDTEEKFIHYWEGQRLLRSRWTNKVMSGLPVAIMFCLPILLLIIVVRLFFPDWYTKIANTASGMLVVVIIGVIIATLFYAYFRMHFKWEVNEQLYHELRAKQKKQQA